MHGLEMIILDEVTLTLKDEHSLLSPYGSQLHIFVYKSQFLSKKYVQQTETITLSYNQSKYKEQAAPWCPGLWCPALWCPASADTSTVQLLHLRLRDNCGRGAKRLQEPEGWEVCCESASPRNIYEATLRSLTNMAA